ncbi:N-acetylmuramoyl-L-alanine amidase [Candidatus Kaistella beijingensis]|jgi:N-acetylmuramoyl-L-alanine amidase|uniref:N-acetylmuramoyl-L-alanine amidase family protein n=1 Tax=Candidatus Kaistella beijingensis TaxID=2820270 RepID=UPI001AC47461|nr:N-acetylmuramoyl-L-alanine amidase [Candidatus Kaistella beijingensis]MBN8622692.1 N-acetylmuramoyl-L-alanine amidase [Flavobacteriales bacterium]MCA0392093.1 N-acetylmuramoyl-L-alanine amidase [Bacteroidota bacterium]UBB89306.1 N-acetylmuramoyl-L-alanine amidase [Candidatus Kaistella beijingensis]
MNRSFSFKKYLLLIFVLLFTFSGAQKKFTIVLDAGHGGTDFGANRVYPETGRLNEKDVTLAVVLKLGRMLEKNKDYKIIYTRKIDEYPSLIDRTNLANRSKADLFISVHCNANTRSAPYGTETFVQGPDQNKTNLEVAKAENDVIYLDEKDKEMFASYDPRSPESLIALKIQQSKYLESSLLFGSFVEGNFEKKDKRFSRGVKQQNLHVLRLNAMPSVLIETGFISNYDDAMYLASEKGQNEIAESIYDAIVSYRKARDRNASNSKLEPEKPEEKPLKNDFRILLMSTPTKYNSGDPALKGLNYILPIKENGLYKYYYSVTNFASVRDNNLKTARDAGFNNATSISFVPAQKLGIGYYTIEVAVSPQKLSSNSYLLNTLKEVERTKENGVFYYTYGKFSSLEDAIKAQKDLDTKGIKNTVIQKVAK